MNKTINIQKYLIIFRIPRITVLLLFIIFFSGYNLKAQTRLMQQPVLSDTHVAFIYAEDLWIANKDGSNPIRLTIDGGIVTAPNVAFYSDKGFRVENEGVAPDIEVEQWPELVIKGHDPQLEKAIEITMKQLKANPTKKIKRPAYPNKTKN